MGDEQTHSGSTPGRQPPPSVASAAASALRFLARPDADPLAGGPRDAEAVRAAEIGYGALVFPLAGLATGALVGVLTRYASGVIPGAAGAAGLAAAAAAVIALWAASSGATLRGLGLVVRRRLGVAAAALAVVGALVVKLAAIAALPGSSIVPALVIGVLLGRWSMIVHAYGSLADPTDPVAPALVRAIGFNQFAVASVTTMALALMLADAIGLVLLLVVASTTVTVRILLHGAFGGVSRASIAAAAEIAETVALVLCAALARVLHG